MSYETYHIPVNFTDAGKLFGVFEIRNAVETVLPVSYTHLRAHETGRNLVCRLLLEKKKKHKDI